MNHSASMAFAIYATRIQATHTRKSDIISHLLKFCRIVSSLLLVLQLVKAQNVHSIASTGQSLSLGSLGTPVLSTSQPYSNVQSYSGGFTPLTASLQGTEVPLVAAANEITHMSPGTGYVVEASWHGVGGTAYSGLKKTASSCTSFTPPTYNVSCAYNELLYYANNAKVKAAAASRAWSFNAVSVTHGETDELNGVTASQYKGFLDEWQSTTQSDINVIRGGSNVLPFFLDQHSSWTDPVGGGSHTVPHVALGQWQAARDYFGRIYMVGPKYQYAYADGTHLTNSSYRLLGEMIGKAMYTVLIKGEQWKPLSPRTITRSGTTLTARFWVPAGSLAFDTTTVSNKGNCKGFEFVDDSGNTYTCTATIASSDTISIVLNTTPTGTTGSMKLRYAYTGTAGAAAGGSTAAHGNVRDNDTATGLAGDHLYDWLITFEESSENFSWDPIVKNQIRIKETTGATQTSRPTTLGRVFARGEIASYPRPSMAGTALTTWQADVKTRWRDGTGNCTVTGATNASPIVITCSSSHGYMEGERVTISGVGGNTAANASWYITPLTTTTFNLHGSTGNGAYTSGGTVAGPADGSAAHAVLAFPLTLQPDDVQYIDFVSDSNPSSAGNSSATQSAAVTKTQLSNWDIGSGAGSWNAKIDLVNGTTHSVDIKSIISSSACTTISTDFQSSGCRYWMAGPVMTQIIVEDRSSSRAFDTGFATGNPIHPFFIVTLFPGLAGMKVDYVMENVWAGNRAGTGMQMVDDAYQVVMKHGASSTAFYTYPSSGTFNHWARSRYRQKAWQGTQPGAIWIDHNFEYAGLYAKLTPNYDQTITIDPKYYNPAYTSDQASATLPSSETYRHAQADGGTDPNDKGLYNTYYMGTGGNNAPYGHESRYLVGWGYSWKAGLTDPNARGMDTVVAEEAETQGHVNAPHLRENLTDRNYCGATNTCIALGLSTVNAYSKAISIDARPQGRFGQAKIINTDSGFTPSADAIGLSAIAEYGAGATETNKWWAYQMSHTFDAVYLPYALSGDYYFLEEMYFYASMHLGFRDWDTSDYQRHGTWGFTWDETRGQGLAIKSLNHAAFFAPSGSPERAYYSEKLANQAAILEGWYGITTGAFYEPGTTSRWYWGRNTVAHSLSNPLAIAVPGGSNDCYYNIFWNDPARLYATTTQWMSTWPSFFMERSNDLGFTFAKPAGDQWLKKHMLHVISDPAMPNHFIFGIEAEKVRNGVQSTCNAGSIWATQMVQTWADVFAGYSDSSTATGSNAQTVTSVADYLNESGSPFHTRSGDAGYDLYYLAAAAYLPGLTDQSQDGTQTLSGDTAYTWLYANVPNKSLWSAIPRMSVVPRAITTVSPIAPFITTSSPLTSGTQSSAYSQSLIATGDTPISWSVTGGSLPTGLSLSSGGLLSGTPSAAGVSTFTAAATNTTGSDSKSFSLTINVPGTPTVGISGNATVSGRVVF
jgi:hypothetical protein